MLPVPHTFRSNKLMWIPEVKQGAIDYLHAVQNSDGGWSYLADQASAVEPTCAVLIALSAERDDFEKSRAAKWLQDSQNRDGGWGYSRNDSQSGWTTAWAILALASQGDCDSGKSHLKSVRWLVDVDVAVSSQGDLEVVEELLALDGSLHGWPWQADQASWVEPTSLTILALRAAGFVEDESRVDGGLAYLTDRRCSNGGWNVGNPRMFDQELPPRAVPSACALLALARCEPTLIDRTDVEALKQEMDEDAGVLALAWGVLALRVLEDESTDFLTLLADRQQPDGSWNRNSYHTALATMALSEELPTCLTG